MGGPEILAAFLLGLVMGFLVLGVGYAHDG